MNTLYLLGGSPRTAKTTIMLGLLAEKKIQFIAADAVTHGLRNVLTGEPHQMLREIELNGIAEHKASFTEGGVQKSFSNSGTELELVLQNVLGMLDYYSRNNESVAFEGLAFTPMWVSSQNFSNFNVRAAFVGFTDSKHVDTIIAHAKENAGDWINVWLKKENGEAEVREWAAKQAVKGEELKAEAESHGYPFFDISSMPFEEYVASVQDYFLG